MKCGNRVLKVVIDERSIVNVVSKSAIAKLKLQPEPHTLASRVAWIDLTSLPVTRGAKYLFRYVIILGVYSVMSYLWILLMCC